MRNSKNYSQHGPPKARASSPFFFLLHSSLFFSSYLDLQSVLTETAGVVELAVARISEGASCVLASFDALRSLSFVPQVTPNSGALLLARRTKRTRSLPNQPLPSLHAAIVTDRLATSEADVVDAVHAAGEEVEVLLVERMPQTITVTLARPLPVPMVAADPPTTPRWRVMT